jgi:hypothetical protein
MRIGRRKELTIDFVSLKVVSVDRRRLNGVGLVVSLSQRFKLCFCFSLFCEKAVEEKFQYQQI